MNILSTMKIGFCPGYPLPPEITGDDAVFRMMEISTECGCSMVQLPEFTTRPATLERIVEEAENRGLELEIGATPDLFELTGANAVEARKNLADRLKIARQLHCGIIRRGYGRLKVATSRFSKDWLGTEQLRHVRNNLKEAAKIMEEYGVMLAIENHCDFKGEELADVLDSVNSHYVGTALDVVNGFTVYTDPVEDVEALAPFAITTHMKNMAVIDHPYDFPHIPFAAVGCALDEGYLDIPWVVDLLAKKSPYARGLHLVIETGWVPKRPGVDRAEEMRGIYESSVPYLKSIINSPV